MESMSVWFLNFWGRASCRCLIPSPGQDFRERLRRLLRNRQCKASHSYTRTILDTGVRPRLQWIVHTLLTRCRYTHKQLGSCYPQVTRSDRGRIPPETGKAGDESCCEKRWRTVGAWNAQIYGPTRILSGKPVFDAAAHQDHRFRAVVLCRQRSENAPHSSLSPST
jgi:hypothetical protein